MEYQLVPVIMVCAIGGTVGALKLIGRLFPNATNIAQCGQDWADRHGANGNRKF